MRLRLYCLIGSLLLIAVFSRCGNPAAPQPPSLQLALPVNDLTATRKGNRVELEWTLQRKNTDRTLVRHLPGIRICRHEGTGLMSNCDVVAEVPPPKLAPQLKLKPTEEVPSIQMNYVDPLPPQLGQENPAGFVTYAVEEVNSHGRSARALQSSTDSGGSHHRCPRRLVGPSQRRRRTHLLDWPRATRGPCWSNLPFPHHAKAGWRSRLYCLERCRTCGHGILS